MLVKIAALVAIAIALAYAATQKAGIDPGDWNASLLATGLIIAIYGALSGSAKVANLDRVTAICMIAVSALVALQLVPLPAQVVRLLSPMRFELGAAAAQLTGGQMHNLTLSATPYETAEYLLTIAGYALVILFVRHVTLQLRDSAWLAIWPLLAVSGFEAALGCYQAYVGVGAEGVTGTYVNRDHYAALLEIALPFALAYPIAVMQRDNRRHESAARPSIKACIAISVFVLLLVGIILSLSRMGFVAMLSSIFVVVAAVVLTRNPHNLPETRDRQWPKWLMVGGLAVVVGLGFFYLQTDALVARFALTGVPGDVSSETRIQIWKDTKQLIKDYPLFGCGAGSYDSCFLRYKTVAPMNTVDYAHNDYLQVLAEFGVFGFVAGLIFVARLLMLTIRGAFSRGSSDNRFIAIACLGSMTAILLHSLVDFNMYVPTNGFAFAWVLGLAAAASPRRRKIPEKLAGSSRPAFTVRQDSLGVHP